MSAESVCCNNFELGSKAVWKGEIRRRFSTISSRCKMACQAPSLVSPPGLYGQLQIRRFAPSQQQPTGSSFPSVRSRRKSSLTWKLVRKEHDAGDAASLKSATLAATSLAGGVTSSCTEVEEEHRSEPKPKKDYIVREAQLDEELWAAAWIRAECYCEEQPYVRYIESYKKKFAEQEFDALKRRLLGKYGQSIKCICFVAVSAQISNKCTVNDSANATILERVVGTLDLSVRHLSQCEAFPGGSIKTTLSIAAPDVRGSHRYGYIANVCVTKASRRNGVASSLLGTAVKAAKHCGLKELYVHVNSSNRAACHLYKKYNFQNMQAEAVEHGLQNVILLQLLL